MTEAAHFIGPNKLLLVRHGESEWNVRRRRALHGQDPEWKEHHKTWQDGDYPLIDVGRDQAAIASKFLGKLGFLFDTHISSSLPRALETGQIIVPTATWQTAEGFKERDWGLTVRRAVIDGIAPQGDWWTQLQAGDIYASAPDGESKVDGLQRYVTTYNDLVLPLDGQNVILAGHGEMMQNAVGYHLGLSIKDWLAQPPIWNLDMLLFEGAGDGSFSSFTHFRPLGEVTLITSQQIDRSVKPPLAALLSK